VTPMPPIIRGSEIQFRHKKVTAVEETASGGAYQTFHAYTENFQPGEGLINDDELGGARHNLVDPTKQAPDLPNPTGSMTVALDRNQIGWWLTSLLGAPVTDDADDPVFEHVWTSGKTAPVLYTIEMPMASDLFRIADAACVSAMSLNLADQGGFRTVDLTFMPRSVRRRTTTLSASLVAAPARDKAEGWNGVAKINGVAFGNIIGGQVNISNGAFMERYFDDSQWPSAVEIGQPSFMATPEIRVRSDAATMLNLFDGVTPFALELLFRATDDRLIKFEAPNVVAPKVLPASQGVGGMSVSPSFMASQTSSAPMLTVTARNAVAAY
jgi:hypothetical protein